MLGAGTLCPVDERVKENGEWMAWLAPGCTLFDFVRRVQLGR